MLRIYYFTLYLPHSDQELHVTIKEHIFKVKSLLNNSLCQFKADLILKIRWPWHVVITNCSTIKNQQKKYQTGAEQTRTSKKIEVGSVHAMKDRASSVDRLHPPSALCRNRENGKIRKQLGDLTSLSKSRKQVMMRWQLLLIGLLFISPIYIQNILSTRLSPIISLQVHSLIDLLMRMTGLIKYAMYNKNSTNLSQYKNIIK